MKIKPKKPFVIDLESSDSISQLKMRFIERGTFLMGSSINEPWRDQYYSTLPTEITLAHDFWIGQFPVTQAQWHAVMKYSPIMTRVHSNCPVENINWYQAISFCEVLNARFIDQLPTGYIFSLPTNTQWEYCCRAGTNDAFFNGNSHEDLEKIAWYAGNSNGQLQLVGGKKSNAWGLFDMIGNVGEWCYDEAGAISQTTQVEMEEATSFYAPFRFVRNGSYSERPEDSVFNCSFHIEHFARIASLGVGLRLCLRHVYDGPYK